MDTAAAVSVLSASFSGVLIIAQLPSSMGCAYCGGALRVVDCWGCRASRRGAGGCGRYVTECECVGEHWDRRSLETRGEVYMLYRGPDGAEWLAPACRVPKSATPATLTGLGESASVFFG